MAMSERVSGGSCGSWVNVSRDPAGSLRWKFEGPTTAALGPDHLRPDQTHGAPHTGIDVVDKIVMKNIRHRARDSQ